MAKTIDEAFNIFHSWLTPSSTESDAAKQHRASIQTCLKSNFDILQFFRSGSFGNGTSIRNYSDVDYFAAIPSKNSPWNSDLLLQQVRNALANRFPNTGVRVDSPAIRVPFGIDAAESTEVVPSKIAGVHGDKYIYEIANGSGGWMRSAPEVHKAYVTDINDKLGKRVKPLIRFIKAWKYYQSVPISSFFLELYVAAYAYTQQSVFYSIDIEFIFLHLWNGQLSGFADPTGVSGVIFPCSSESKRIDALSKLKNALSRAQNARLSEKDCNLADAFLWWNRLYDYKFPQYG